MLVPGNSSESAQTVKHSWPPEPCDRVSRPAIPPPVSKASPVREQSLEEKYKQQAEGKPYGALKRAPNPTESQESVV